jgi:hypothetical protein
MLIYFLLTNQLALDFRMLIMEKLLFAYYIPWQQIKVFYPQSAREEAAKDIAAVVHVFENFSKFAGRDSTWRVNCMGQAPLCLSKISSGINFY